MQRTTIPVIGPVMSPYQRKIIEGAPRHKFFYVNGRRAGLIPDTEKARRWAVEKRGATHFDVFSFHRFNINKKPSSYKVGDFYCVIRSKSNKHIGDSPVLACINTELTLSFKLLDLSACRLIYLGRSALGLSLPATIFGIEHGNDILPLLYMLFCDGLSRAVSRQYPGEFIIQYSDRIDAENKKINSNSYAVPFFINEAESFSEHFFENISKTPRTLPVVNSPQMIGDVVLGDLRMTALAAWQQNSRKFRDNMSFEPGPLRVLGTSIAAPPMCSPNLVVSAMKCATKLVSRFRTKGIHEFRRRDALIAVSGTEWLYGKYGNGGGVADALIILISYGYIKECPFPPIDFPCGRPSPWYVVNPGVFSRQDPTHIEITTATNVRRADYVEGRNA